MQQTNHSRVLFALLDANKDFALHGKGTTNHCPMALIALSSMGASDQRLRDFFEFWKVTYAIEAEVSTQRLTITHNNYLAFKGKSSHFTELHHFFSKRIESEGIRHVVGEVIRVLPLAPATGAFHALIRLSYGVQVSHRGEVAAGLAAMVTNCFSTHLPKPGRNRCISLVAGFSQLSSKFEGYSVDAAMITTKMRAVFNDARFQSACPALPDRDGILFEMRKLAILCYSQTQNFTVLHMVTALDALVGLLEVIPELSSEQLLEDIWTALCVAYVSMGAPPILSPPLPASAPGDSVVHMNEWRHLLELAVQSNDDHVIKFTYSCFVENQRRPNPLYLHSTKLIHCKSR